MIFAVETARRTSWGGVRDALPMCPTLPSLFKQLKVEMQSTKGPQKIHHMWKYYIVF